MGRRIKWLLMTGVALLVLLALVLVYLARVWRAPVVVPDPAGGLRLGEGLLRAAPRTLVVAAHPDDVEWYMGGTLARLAAAGAEVTVVMATNGEAGRGRGSLPAGRLGEVRRAEQVEASRRLGVVDVRFLELADGRLQRCPDLAGRIREVWGQVRPELVFSFDSLQPRPPYIHADHQAVGRAVSAIASSPLGAGVQVLLFHSRAPDVIVDISEVLARKVAALMAHRTQMGDGLAAIEAMHRASAGAVGRQAGVAYGEAFRRKDPRGPGGR